MTMVIVYLNIIYSLCNISQRWLASLLVSADVIFQPSLTFLSRDTLHSNVHCWNTALTYISRGKVVLKTPISIRLWWRARERERWRKRYPTRGRCKQTVLLGDRETGIESGANIYRMWRSAKSVGGNSGEAVRGGGVRRLWVGWTWRGEGVVSRSQRDIGS